MSYGKTWSGDWRSRILERVRLRGFESMTAYAAAHVGVPLLTLAQELGPDDVAATQLETLLMEEATRTSTIPHALRDVLVRKLRQRLPEGWNSPLDEQSRVKIVGALVDWETEHEDYLDKPATFTAGQDLLDAELPTGWLPAGPDDVVIVNLVERCLGRRLS